jgi:hypothetical protein
MTLSLLTLLIAFAAAAGSPAPGAVPQLTAGAPAEAATIEQFHAEIEKYMAFRRQLLDEVRGPVPNSTALEVNNASDALAAAIRRARPNARQGSFFLPPVADVLKQRVINTVRTANLAPVLAGIDDEGPAIRRPSIYLRFPAHAQMASMPPSLLAALPALPKELEYRIVGSFLVLRDVDAALVLDYIPAAIPR